MTVTVTSVRPAPTHAPAHLVVVGSGRAASRARLPWRVALVGALLGGLAGLLGALALLRTTPVDTLFSYAAAGYAGGTVAGALLGLLVGSVTAAAAAALSRRRKPRRVPRPQRVWVRHRSA